MTATNKPQGERKTAFEKEDAYRSLELINGWIENLDTKASFLLAYIAVLMGFVVSNGLPSIFNTSVPLPITKDFIGKALCIVLLYLSLISSVIILLLVLTARTKAKSKESSLLFFNEISKMGLNDFRSKVLNRTEEELVNDVLEQVHTNAVICTKKSRFYNWGVKGTFLATITYIGCIMLRVL